MNFISLILFSMIGLASPDLSAAAKTPNLVGQIGFDWLQPKKTKCAPISQKIQDSFKSCEVFDAKSTQSFAGKGNFHTCQAGPHHEYMVYKTRARCVEEFTIMESNGD